jgi:hypothetical protein
MRLAEPLQEDEADRSEALTYLNLAPPELRDLKMQPALALIDTYQAPPANALSNRRIAERLLMTEGTVEVHVKHSLNKLGFRSRSQVAVWIAQQQADRPGTDRT